MMNSLSLAPLALSAFVAWSGPALAAMAGVAREPIPAWQSRNGAAIYVLESAAAQARQRARMNKGARECFCLMKNVELQDLINRLKRGEQVALEEIIDAVDGLLRPESSYESVAFARCD